MGQTPTKRKIVIHIDDYCEEPFIPTDNQYFRNQVTEMLADYDVEITGVTIEEATQSDWQDKQHSG